MATYVLVDKCDGCQKCIEACALQAVFIGNDGKAEIDPDKCRDCESCLEACPLEAIVQT